MGHEFLIVLATAGGSVITGAVSALGTLAALNVEIANLKTGIIDAKARANAAHARIDTHLSDHR